MTASGMPMPNNPASQQVLVDSDCPLAPYFTQDPECVECDGYEDELTDMYADCDFTEAGQRQSDEYANSALKHYNNDDKNVIKYELVKAITSCGFMDTRGFYGHVNFTAKSTLENSKEEFFFAEVCWDSDTVPTCVVSLEGKERVGGLRGIRIINPLFNGMDIPVDTQNCYACDEGLKHPKDGTLYESGHSAMNGCYGYDDY